MPRYPCLLIARGTQAQPRDQTFPELSWSMSSSALPVGDFGGQAPVSGARVAASTSELARSARSARTGVCTFVNRGGDPPLKWTCSHPSCAYLPMSE